MIIVSMIISSDNITIIIIVSISIYYFGLTLFVGVCCFAHFAITKLGSGIFSIQFENFKL